MNKTELTNLLKIPSSADMQQVRERVRALPDRELDAVAAQVVLGLKPVEYFGRPAYSTSLDAADTLRQRIEALGLTKAWILLLWEMAVAKQLSDTAAYHDLTHELATEVRLATSTARQRTEASVIAVVGSILAEQEGTE